MPRIGHDTPIRIATKQVKRVVTIVLANGKSRPRALQLPGYYLPAIACVPVTCVDSGVTDYLGAINFRGWSFHEAFTRSGLACRRNQLGCTLCDQTRRQTPAKFFGVARGSQVNCRQPPGTFHIQHYGE